MTHIRMDYPDLPYAVEVIDCTLRDGEQAPGVWFTLEEKLELAELLSDAGVDVLDAGFPAASQSDIDSLQEMKRLNLRARIGATARAVKNDVVLAEKARADEVFLFMPTSDFRITETLGVSRERATAMFRAGAEEVAARAMVLNLVFEDATRADPSLLVRLTEELRRHVPVRRVIVCDTVGCAFPRSMERLVGTLRRALGDDVNLCTHCHNDFGLATANTLAAVCAGAKTVTCTVNALGERAGNADLAETVAALTHILCVDHRVDPKSLPRLSEAVERMSGIHTSPTKAVTGFNVYRHESGVHVDGMLKNSKSYEFLPSSWVGCETKYVLGKHSGKALLRLMLAEVGIPADERLVEDLLAEVKNAIEHRSKEQHHRAHALKQAFATVALSGVDPAVVLARFVDRAFSPRLKSA